MTCRSAKARCLAAASATSLTCSSAAGRWDLISLCTAASPSLHWDQTFRARTRLHRALFARLVFLKMGAMQSWHSVADNLASSSGTRLQSLRRRPGHPRLSELAGLDRSVGRVWQPPTSTWQSALTLARG